MILFEHVCFAYTEGQSAVHNIHLKIPHGENVAVAGANGAGKSTLLKLAAGRLAAGKGSIMADGIPVQTDSLTLLQRKIGYIGQQHSHPADSTVKNYIAASPRGCGYSKAEVNDLTAYAIETMHLKPLAKRNMDTLSLGEQRIVDIAAVLAKQPSILILDDPTAFLDAKARYCLMNSLQALHHTKLIATHDLDLALTLCGKVIVLKEGNVYAYGSTQTLLRNVSLLQACNLELPLSAQTYNIYTYR